jgi:hypothetical protein
MLALILSRQQSQGEVQHDGPSATASFVPAVATGAGADLHARQQARKRRPLDRRADRVSYFGGLKHAGPLEHLDFATI